MLHPLDTADITRVEHSFTYWANNNGAGDRYFAACVVDSTNKEIQLLGGLSAAQVMFICWHLANHLGVPGNTSDD